MQINFRNYCFWLVPMIVLFSIFSTQLLHADETIGANLIPNGDFRGDIVNNLPSGWAIKSARPSLAPTFKITEKRGERYLYVSGNGNADCAGWASTPVEITLGKTYLFRVQFKQSKQINPIQHLFFTIVLNGATHEILEFHRLEKDWVEGTRFVSFPGNGKVTAEVQILYRLCAKGKLWVHNISLIETEPVEPRWVRLACTQGPGSLEQYGLKSFSRALDVAGQNKADLILLPEYINGELVQETMAGPSVKLMSEKARQYGMYVAGTIGLYDEEKDRLYNSALLFDRQGNLAGRYDKIHLYGPELNWDGVTPGSRVDVFKTDFGKVGFMTCADSWYTDVAELAVLKGADILLFPNLGYDRTIMHARARDNMVNIITSSRSGQYGVWDFAGQDLIAISSDQSTSSSFKDIVQTLEEDKLGILIMTLNLNSLLNGGTRTHTLRGIRYGGNQRIWLEDQIKEEKQRWWIE